MFKRRRYTGMGSSRVMPTKMWKKFVFTDTYPSNVTLSAASQFVSTRFRANSPYDPDVSTGLGQRSANYWGKWSNFYDRYVVTGCKVTVWPYLLGVSGNPNGAGGITAFPPLDCAIIFSLNEILADDDIQTLRSHPYSKWIQFHRADMPFYKKSLTNYIKIGRLNGLDWNSTNNYAAWLTNPTRSVYANIIIGSDHAGALDSIACEVRFAIKITYYTLMHSVDMSDDQPDED